jgi:hypothetical protein
MSSREGSGYPIGRIIFASGLGTMIEWYDSAAWPWSCPSSYSRKTTRRGR